MTESKMVRKVTLKSVAGNIVKGVAAEAIKDGTAIAVLSGRVQGFKAIQTNYGESIQFNGYFEAVGLLTGEKIHGIKFFAPADLEGLLLAQFENSENGEVIFSAEIGIELSETSNVGFAYTIQPLVKSTDDPLAAIREQIMAALPTPAAKAKAKAADEPKAEPKAERKAKA